jgi:hypothetical protein
MSLRFRVDANAKETKMITVMDEEVFLSPESVISGVFTEHEVGGPEIDFEEDVVPADGFDTPAYA